LKSTVKSTVICDCVARCGEFSTLTVHLSPLTVHQIQKPFTSDSERQSLPAPEKVGKVPLVGDSPAPNSSQSRCLGVCWHRSTDLSIRLCAVSDIQKLRRAAILNKNQRIRMESLPEADDAAEALVLRQAERVAIEVARAEVIVSNALGIAAIAMAAKGITGTPKMTEHAMETLQVARIAATRVLQVAKKEAELTLRLATRLASARRAEEEDVKLGAETAPVVYCK
jgi:hypothetical protein